MQTILVTGAAGFIGSNLVLELLRSLSPVQIIGLDNMNDYYDVSIKEYRLEQIAASAADASAFESADSLQTAVLIFVLNGQFAAGVSLVVLQSGMASAALQLVVAIQLDIGIALASHAHGGFAPSAGVDVQILERDLNLIVLIFGLDGHGVGRSFVLVTICDNGVGVFHLRILPL